MKLPISIIILTYNEEKNIKDCFESAAGWSNEMFIVDSGSTDKTIEIARRYTNKIYYHTFENYAKQRNWAQNNLPIKNKWIFHLDADERVDEELISELKKIFSSDEIKTDGFMVPRKTIFNKKWIRHGGHYPIYHLRMFKKEKGSCEERLYDQHFILKGKVAKIKGNIINVIESNPRLLRIKQQRWVRPEAQAALTYYPLHNKQHGFDLKDNPIEERKWLKNNVYYKMPLFIRPFLYFFYRYVFKLGFLDGKNGFIFHFWQGFWFRFLVDLEIAKLKK